MGICVNVMVLPEALAKFCPWGGWWLWWWGHLERGVGSGGACCWRLSPSLAGASVQMSINARALPEDALSPLAPPLPSLFALLASITYLGLNHLGTAGGAREFFAWGGLGVNGGQGVCGRVWGAVAPVLEDSRLHQEVHP